MTFPTQLPDVTLEPPASERRLSKSPTGTKLWSRPSTKIFAPLISLAIIVAGWELGFRITEGIGFPSFFDVISSLGALAVSAQFWFALWETLWLSVAGLILGLVIAVALGLAVGPHAFLIRSSLPTVNFLRVIPSIVLIPLFIVSWGNSLGMVLALTATVSSFKLIPFVIRGIHDTLPTLRESAHLLGLSRSQAAISLFLPAAAATIMTGIRLTIARAYSAVVLVGLTTTGPGLGGQLIRAKISLNTAEVFAYSLIAGVVGVAFFFAFSWLEKKVIFWSRATS